MIDKDTATVLAALITASSALLVAVVTVSAGYSRENRTRRRTLFGEAFKAAASWSEMVYRVRRRAPGIDAELGLVDRFHTLQEEIDYHSGWIGSESIFMRRSYERFVFGIKSAARQSLQEAWETTPSMRPARSLADLPPIDDRTLADSFLFDVRCHLAWWKIPRLVLVWRNRKGRG